MATPALYSGYLLSQVEKLLRSVAAIGQIDTPIERIRRRSWAQGVWDQNSKKVTNSFAFTKLRDAQDLFIRVGRKYSVILERLEPVFSSRRFIEIAYPCRDRIVWRRNADVLLLDNK